MSTHDGLRHPDWDLVCAVLRGDSASYDRFLTKMQTLPAIAYAMNSRRGGVLSDHELQDAVQDCLTALWNQLSSYEGRGSLQAWMVGICRNELSHARAAKLAQANRTVEPLLGALEARADERSPHRLDFDEAELLHQALARLPRLRSELIRLKHYESMSLPEIATKLKMSLSKVKSQYFRGLKQLEAELAKPFGYTTEPAPGLES